MMLLAGVSAAFAESFDVKVCVDYDLDFVDSGVGEDYYTSNGPTDALAVRVTATSNLLVHVAYTLTTGSDRGCVTFPLSDGTSGTVKVESQISPASQKTLTVRNGSTNAIVTRTVTSNFTPNAATTLSHTLPVTPAWSTLAVASRALTRNDAGLSAFAFDVFVPGPLGAWSPPAGCDPNASCLNGTDLWLHGSETERKFLTAYRLGWLMLHQMGFDRDVLDKGAADAHCRVVNRSLTLGNLEYTAVGFLEGYAHWYASTVFNQSDQADCMYVFWEAANWDQLDVCHQAYEAPEGHAVACDVGPKLPSYDAIVPDTNYRGYCLEERNPELASASKPALTVSPLDVVRFLKSRDYEDAGLTRSEIGQVIAAGLTEYEDPADALDYRFALRSRALLLGANATSWEEAVVAHGLDQ